MPMPGKPAPTLSLPTLGGRFDLSRDGGANGTLLVFYRGLHCPICAKQLTELQDAAVSFAQRAVTLVAISADPEEKAREMAEKAGAHDLTVAHSLPLAAARDDWGLLISSAREDSKEPPLFAEPGVFYVRPDGTLWAEWTQSAPFGRPPVDGFLKAIDFAVDKGYPPRGTYEGPL